MLNGELAQNPYWVAAWVAAFAGLAGLLAPDRSLRCSRRLPACQHNITIFTVCFQQNVFDGRSRPP